MFAFFALSEKRAWKALLSGEAYSSEYLQSDKKLLLEAIHIINPLTFTSQKVGLIEVLPISLGALICTLCYKLIRRSLQITP